MLILVINRLECDWDTKNRIGVRDAGVSSADIEGEKTSQELRSKK